MNTEEFNAYLNDRYFKEQKWYDDKSVYNQKQYRKLQWILIIFSSLTPVFIITDYVLRDILIFLPISVISAVIVAIFGSAIRIFKYYDNWLNYRTVSETLKKELHLYNASIDEYAQSDNKESLFVKRVEALISRENTLWITTYKKENDDKS